MLQEYNVSVICVCVGGGLYIEVMELMPGKKRGAFQCRLAKIQALKPMRLNL